MAWKVEDGETEADDELKTEESKELYARKQQEHQGAMGEVERRKLEASIDE